MALIREVKTLLSTDIKMNGIPVWLVDLTTRKAQWKAEKTHPAKKQRVEGDGQLGTAAAKEAAVGPALAGSGAQTAPLQGDLLAAKDPSF